MRDVQAALVGGDACATPRHARLELDLKSSAIGIATQRVAATGLLAFGLLLQAQEVHPQQAFTADEERRIGSRDDPEVGFTRIAFVAMDRAGTVYVFEAQDHEIRSYDAAGELIWASGRSGPGPGEFREQPAIGVLGDTLWAVEPTVRRITLFEASDGQLLAAHQFDDVELELQPVDRLPGLPRERGMSVTTGEYRERPGGYTVGKLVPFSLVPGGVFITELREAPAAGPSSRLRPMDNIVVPRLAFTVEGEVVDTLGWTARPSPESVDVEFVEQGGMRYLVPYPPLDEPLRRALPDGEVVVDRRTPMARDGATFSVTRVDLAGNTLFARRYDYQPVPYRESLLDSMAAEAALRPGILPNQASVRVGFHPGTAGVAVNPDYHSRRAANAARARRRIRAAMRFPEFQPPVQGLRVGEAGWVWLRREEDHSGLARWLILDEKGAPVGNLAWPEDQRIVWSSARVLWAVQRDELGLEWLVQYELRLPGAGPR